MKTVARAAAAFLIVAVCGFHLAHSIVFSQKYLYDAWRFCLYYGMPFAGLALAAWLVWSRSERSLAVGVNVAAVVAALLAFEAVKIAISVRQDRTYDVFREDYDAALATHDRVSVAVPILSYARQLEAVGAGADRLFPLAGLARAHTLLCAEGRPLVTYASDRHGFNNPDRLWDAPQLQAALIGDSFIHGQCNAAPHAIADIVREKVPATLGLAFSGNGPLLELATLVEYGRKARPRNAVWCFFEGNDFDELEAEAGFAVLKRYLEPEPSLRLASRQPEVDAIVKAKLDRDVVGKLERRPQGASAGRSGLLGALASKQSLRRVIGLQTLGAELGLAWGRGGGDQRLLAQVLGRAKAEVASWGGTLHFCYLPSSARYRGRLEIRAPFDSYRGRTLATASSLGLPVIDVTEAFERSGARMTLFLPTGMHYSDQGARLAGEAIVRHLFAVGN